MVEGAVLPKLPQSLEDVCLSTAGVFSARGAKFSDVSSLSELEHLRSVVVHDYKNEDLVMPSLLKSLETVNCVHIYLRKSSQTLPCLEELRENTKFEQENFVGSSTDTLFV